METRGHNNRDAKHRCSSSTFSNAVDIYGQNFYLSFKGQKTFNTTLGGITTIMVVAIFLSYAAFKAIILLEKSDLTTNTNEYIKAVNYTNPEMVQINELGFDFSFQIDTPITPRLGRMALYREIDYRLFNETTGVDDYVTDLEELETITCGTENFNYSDSSEIIRKGINEYFCLKNKSEMVVGGTYFTSIF
jgi:hypothetical protein